MQPICLENGLTLVIGFFPGKSTGIDFCINYGSAFERRGEAGIAHFLEHVFFSGSKKLGRKKPFELIEGRGGELNAFTSKEETHYYSRIQNKEFNAPLRVLGECFNNGFFEKRSVEIEKKIILNEIRELTDNPVKRLFDEFIEICLQPPYNKRTIGTKKSVKAIDSTRLRKCLKKNYCSKNCVLGIATSLKEEKIIKEVEESFMPRKGRRKTLKESPPKPRAVERESKAKTEQAHCCLGFPVMNACHKDYLTLELIEVYLGGGLSSKLVQEIREKRGLSYAVSANLNAEKTHGLFTVYFSTEPEKVEMVKKLVLKEFKKLQEREISNRILSKIKKQLIGSKALEQESSFNSAKSFVESWLYGAGPFDQIIKRIGKIKPRDIKRVSREFLQTEEFAFASLLPLKKKQKN